MKNLTEQIEKLESFKDNLFIHFLSIKGFTLGINGKGNFEIIGNNRVSGILEFNNAKDAINYLNDILGELK